MALDDSEPHKAARTEPGSSARTEYYLPRGVLAVTVHGGSEFEGRNKILGRYDPYVKIVVYNRSQQQTAYTKVSRNEGSSARWEETILFPLESDQNFCNRIKLEVLDSNIVNQDSFMGEVSLDLADIPGFEPSKSRRAISNLEKLLTLKSKKGPGKIRISIGFEAKTANEMFPLRLPVQNGEPPKRTAAVK